MKGINVWIVCSCNSNFREGNGTPLQYSCLENPMDGGAWWAAVHGVTKSRTRLKRLGSSSSSSSNSNLVPLHRSLLQTVCMYVYIYIYIHIYTYTYICMYVYVCMYLCCIYSWLLNNTWLSGINFSLSSFTVKNPYMTFYSQKLLY